ncbi:MAG: ATP-binding protein [Candidatus Synoicihabitans palmerolidicus]|nr:ATP-binding protein [Candidatus Synoicihabitans palmerolidicus]
MILTGTESTGKSALAAALAAHYGERWAQEYVRGFWERREGVITSWDLATIARGQLANEEEAMQKAKRVVFCDTNLLSNVLWADELYDGKIASWVREEAEVRAAGYALYLYCEPDLPWEEDTQRVFRDREAWLASAERCRKMLDTRGLAYVSVRGKGEERVAMGIAAVERMWAE